MCDPPCWLGLVGSSVEYRSRFGKLLRKLCRVRPLASVTLPPQSFGVQIAPTNDLCCCKQIDNIAEVSCFGLWFIPIKTTLVTPLVLILASQDSICPFTRTCSDLANSG